MPNANPATASSTFAFLAPDGEVWLHTPAAAGYLARPRLAGSGLDLAGFARGCRPPGVRVLLADPAQFPLALALADRQVAVHGFCLDVARPPGIDWPGLITQGPAAVLARLAALPEFHWWRFLPATWTALGLATSGPDDTVAALVRAHPAYPALSFIAGRDDVALGRLVGEVVDPRFFLGHDASGALDRLAVFLGLASNDPGKLSRAQRRRRALVDAAWGADAPPGDLEAPGLFLRRRQAEARRLDGGELAEGIGTLRAAADFARFLEAAWMDTVALRGKPRGGKYGNQGLLIPEHLFREPADAAAFKEHLARHCPPA